MITDVAQRWRGGRASYRPVGELLRFDPRRYEVAALDGPGSDKIAKAFVVEHHYSASYPSARVRMGLYRGPTLVGVAVFSTPTSGAVLDALPCPRAAAVELGRLVMLDDVEAHGETWFIARAFEELRRRGFAGVVSFADPVPRAATSGEVVFPGHVGTIYQASSALYAGLSRARMKRLLPDGRVLDDRTISKIRNRERGWRYAVDRLVLAGAAEPAATGGAELQTWLAHELGRITRPLRHGGNHRYLFALAPFVRRRLAKLYPDLPYPKLKVTP